MWSAGDDEKYSVILAWLPEKKRKAILERADLYIWWQENEGNWVLDEKTKSLLKHCYILASSQALGDGDLGI